MLSCESHNYLYQHNIEVESRNLLVSSDGQKIMVLGKTSVTILSIHKRFKDTKYKLSTFSLPENCSISLNHDGTILTECRPKEIRFHFIFHDIGGEIVVQPLPDLTLKSNRPKTHFITAKWSQSNPSILAYITVEEQVKGCIIVFQNYDTLKEKAIAEKEGTLNKFAEILLR